MAGNNQIVSLNMTGFFRRELKMYALGDIKFKKPIAIKQVAIILALFIVWTLPLILIFGVQFNPLYAVFLIGPPIGLGIFATRPMFGGKTLFDFVKTAIVFLGEPKAWADFKAFQPKETYTINSEIWIGRRRELQILADMIESK